MIQLVCGPLAARPASRRRGASKSGTQQHFVVTEWLPRLECDPCGEVLPGSRAMHA